MGSSNLSAHFSSLQTIPGSFLTFPFLTPYIDPSHIPTRCGLAGEGGGQEGGRAGQKGRPSPWVRLGSEGRTKILSG